MNETGAFSSKTNKLKELKGERRNRERKKRKGKGQVACI